jgi:hypothetical protein
VKYQICFPSRFDFLNNSEALVGPSNLPCSKPAGGLYGEVLNETVLDVDSFAGCLLLH